MLSHYNVKQEKRKVVREVERVILAHEHEHSYTFLHQIAKHSIEQSRYSTYIVYSRLLGFQ